MGIKIDRKLCNEGDALHTEWCDSLQRIRGKWHSNASRVGVGGWCDAAKQANESFMAMKSYFRHRSTCPKCKVEIWIGEEV